MERLHKAKVGERWLTIDEEGERLFVRVGDSERLRATFEWHDWLWSASEASKCYLRQVTDERPEWVPGEPQHVIRVEALLVQAETGVPGATWSLGEAGEGFLAVLQRIALRRLAEFARCADFARPDRQART